MPCTLRTPALAALAVAGALTAGGWCPAADAPPQLSKFQAKAAGIAGESTSNAPGTTPPDFARLIVAARRNFQPPAPDALSLRRRELLDAIAELQNLLDKSPVEQAGAWRSYFRLDEVQGALSADTRRQLETLAELRTRLTDDVAGLELPEVVAVRKAAIDYAAALRLSETDMAAEYLKKLDELSGALRAYEPAPTQAGADRIGTILAWLDDAGQAAELTAAVRDHWSRPNWFIRIGTEFIKGYAERDITERCRQSANILGTHVVGPTVTAARLELSSVENPHRAELNLRLTGSAECVNNVGTNGPAVIRSGSVSQFEVIKRLYFDPVRGLADSKAEVRCNADIKLHNIVVEPRVLPRLTTSLMTDVAWNKAREQHPAAEREVARLVAARVERRLDNELASPLERAQEFFHRAAYVRPLRLNELAEITSRSTEGFVELTLHRARPHQLGAPDVPPEFVPDAMIGVAVHHSTFNNTSARAGLLHSVEQTDEQIEQYAAKLGGEVPPALRVFSNSVRWSATLDSEAEFSLTFDNQCADATFHTLAWTIGERRFERPIDVRVNYKIENSRLGMLFVRQGEIEIRAVDGRAWSRDEREYLVPHMEAKLAAIFPPTGRFNALIVPHGEAFGPLGSIELTQLICDDGWLVLGYQSKGEQAAGKAE